MRLQRSPIFFWCSRGTCLAKVHAGFYRLSEDIDFLIPVEINAKRSIKRELITPVKDAFEQWCASRREELDSGDVGAVTGALQALPLKLASEGTC